MMAVTACLISNPNAFPIWIIDHSDVAVYIKGYNMSGSAVTATVKVEALYAE